MNQPDDSSGHAEAVVEPNIGKPLSAEVTTSILHRRIRQQELLAEMGVLALEGNSFLELLNHTSRLTAKGLEAEFCKVLEYIPAENCFLVRAGVGWPEDVVGVTKIGADLESPSGFALRTGKPVISNHLENEQRFRTPALLLEHGIRRAMNVILQGDGLPYGVLEVDSRSEGEFGKDDIAFLQGVANILGMAIERQRYERRLKAALDRQQVLAHELTHRVKNSLQLVSSMLHVQANGAEDDVLRSHLNAASARVSAIGHAYERLSCDMEAESIDISAYLSEVCADVIAAAPNCTLDFDGTPGIWLDADRAISLALIVNEVVTNATKYAFPNGDGGRIWVSVARRDPNTVLVTVRDDGIGLPADFDRAKSTGLGMRIVTALAEQLGGKITQSAGDSEFILSFGLSDPMSALGH